MGPAGDMACAWRARAGHVATERVHSPVDRGRARSTGPRWTRRRPDMGGGCAVPKPRRRGALETGATRRRAMARSSGARGDRGGPVTASRGGGAMAHGAGQLLAAPGSAEGCGRSVRTPKRRWKGLPPASSSGAAPWSAARGARRTGARREGHRRAGKLTPSSERA